MFEGYKKTKTFSDFCRYFRESRKLTTREAAAIFGVNQSYISQIETEKYHLPVAFAKKLKKKLTEDEIRYMKTILKSELISKIEKEIDSI